MCRCYILRLEGERLHHFLANFEYGFIKLSWEGVGLIKAELSSPINTSVFI